ncbi:MAG: DEAD/DEAH box helicase [Tepidisphaeraceae bacterium]
MSLIDELAKDFAFQIRSKGKQYYLDDAVELTTSDVGVVQAKVQGSNAYRVECRWHERDQVSFSCTCPHYQDKDEPCKHIWAALLEADHQGVLDLAARRLGGDVPKMRFNGQGGHSNGLVASPPPGQSSNTPSSNGLSRPARVSMWRAKLAKLNDHSRLSAIEDVHDRQNPWPNDRRMVYAIDVEGTRHGYGGVVVELFTQKRNKAGKWAEPRRYTVNPDQWLNNPDERDRRIAQYVLGSDGFHNLSPQRRIELARWAHGTTLKEMVETGRCYVLDEGKLSDEPLVWDDTTPWEFVLDLRADENSKGHHVVAMLRRRSGEWGVGSGEKKTESPSSEPANVEAVSEPVQTTEPSKETPHSTLHTPHSLRPLADALALTASGWVVFADRVSRFQHHGAWPTLVAMREQGEIIVPAGEELELLGELLKLPRVPPVVVPESLGLEDVRVVPRPVVTIRRQTRDRTGPPRLTVDLLFDYAGTRVDIDEPRVTLLLLDQKKIIHRDRSIERRHRQSLQRGGAREEFDANLRRHVRYLWPEQLPGAVAEWIRLGWQVEADGSLYRAAGNIDAKLSSGIDWFDLQVTVDFGNGISAKLPKLLEALARGDKFVKLDDGTLGVMPEEWLAKYAMLAGVGKAQEDGALRFGKNQAALLDALLAQMPAVNVDEVFSQARSQLTTFEGIDASEPVDSFVGELRPYQKQGLGWLQFLRNFRFGGCLADDMGLGKTIQVLALLEARRREKSGPSLVVVPRSLVFNWRAEAQKFCPTMRVLDHSGALRSRDVQAFADYDLVLTTYGTLRRDIAELKEFKFDYVVLDESQAIKNSATASAKAVRLLRSNHRLAMSGTPIENHLGELWSLFEFLNPGMLGSASLFKALSSLGSAKPNENAQKAPDAKPQAALDNRKLIAHALRPFILRRTKKQVASDLPERVEQTIHCELSEQQRKLYDELREHYRTNVMSQVESIGLGRSQIQILEALLRLRQAACHPGLIDQKYASEPSAKLDVLVEQIAQIMEENEEGKAPSKALVFSQFTSFLGLLKTRLDALGIEYEYLDGKTRDRQAHVDRFQNDPKCKLFLVSLKAGGVGLNLTAAEYVFLLDPWWNPAVEAQAIDRAHRIGQTRTVFAYRLIAKDTVEEKVLTLQSSKRQLADAIINEDNSLTSGLSAEDLKLLLS